MSNMRSCTPSRTFNLPTIPGFQSPTTPETKATRRIAANLTCFMSHRVSIWNQAPACDQQDSLGSPTRTARACRAPAARRTRPFLQPSSADQADIHSVARGFAIGPLIALATDFVANFALQGFLQDQRVLRWRFEASRLRRPPPGVENVEVFRDARGGYFVSDDRSGWQDSYEQLALASHRLQPLCAPQSSPFLHAPHKTPRESRPSRIKLTIAAPSRSNCSDRFDEFTSAGAGTFRCVSFALH